MRKGGLFGVIATGAMLFAGMAGAQPASSDARDRSGARGDGEHIALVCYGEEERLTNEYRSGSEWDRDKRRYEPRSGYELTTKTHDTAVTVQIDGGSGRIRPNKDMLPALHSDNDDGWYDIRNLSISADTITGDFKLNGLNHPKMTIDRRSGRIKLEGLTNFHGTCDAVGADRKF